MKTMTGQKSYLLFTILARKSFKMSILISLGERLRIIIAPNRGSIFVIMKLVSSVNDGGEAVIRDLNVIMKVVVGTGHLDADESLLADKCSNNARFARKRLLKEGQSTIMSVDRTKEEIYANVGHFFQSSTIVTFRGEPVHHSFLLYTTYCDDVRREAMKLDHHDHFFIARR